MRIDVVTIFPDYLDPLRLSLPGKAIREGRVDLVVHDLRTWTHDRHRTVDDTPYGGGAGMVLRPEPWGEALDALVQGGTTVVVPTPSGRPLTQALARELAGRSHLLFACGRYEGIDQRVLDHAGSVAEVVEVSLGDYVLNGGEVAALVVTEAVVRLLPGVLGNPASLVEESHEDGLLEYPVYTRPPSWRGRDVPDVLLGGDHGAVAAWRRERARERTASRRPDLLRAETPPGALPIVPAHLADAPELHVLTLACWVREALANDTLRIPALHESLDDTRAGLAQWTTWVVRDPQQGGRLVASVRGRLDDDEWDVGRLMVAPDRRGQGLGCRLLDHVLTAAPPTAASIRLYTGAASAGNLRMYRRAGFRVTGHLDGDEGVLVLRRRR